MTGQYLFFLATTNSYEFERKFDESDIFDNINAPRYNKPTIIAIIGAIITITTDIKKLITICGIKNNA